MSKITVHLGRKIGDGNFGSVDIQFSVEDENQPGESTGKAFDRIYGFVEEKLIEHATEFGDAVSESVKSKKSK